MATTAPGVVPPLPVAIFERVVIPLCYGDAHVSRALWNIADDEADALFDELSSHGVPSRETAVGHANKSLTYGEVVPASIAAHVIPSLALDADAVLAAAGMAEGSPATAGAPSAGRGVGPSGSGGGRSKGGGQDSDSDGSGSAGRGSWSEGEEAVGFRPTRQRSSNRAGDVGGEAGSAGRRSVPSSPGASSTGSGGSGGRWKGAAGGPSTTVRPCRTLSAFVSTTYNPDDARTILPGDVFYDLGSGTGKIPLQVALQTSVAKAVGVEFAKARHNLAQSALDAVTTRSRDELTALVAGQMAREGDASPPTPPLVTAGTGTGDDAPWTPALVVDTLMNAVRRVHAVCANFLTTDLSDATVIFVNNTVFEPSLMVPLLARLAALPRLRTLLLLRPICPRHSARCEKRGDPCSAFVHPPVEGICNPTWCPETTIFTYVKLPAQAGGERKPAGLAPLLTPLPGTLAATTMPTSGPAPPSSAARTEVSEGGVSALDVMGERSPIRNRGREVANVLAGALPTGAATAMPPASRPRRAGRGGGTVELAATAEAPSGSGIALPGGHGSVRARRMVAAAQTSTMATAAPPSAVVPASVAPASLPPGRAGEDRGAHSGGVVTPPRSRSGPRTSRRTAATPTSLVKYSPHAQAAVAAAVAAMNEMRGSGSGDGGVPALEPGQPKGTATPPRPPTPTTPARPPSGRKVPHNRTPTGPAAAAIHALTTMDDAEYARLMQAELESRGPPVPPAHTHTLAPLATNITTPARERTPARRGASDGSGERQAPPTTPGGTLLYSTRRSPRHPGVVTADVAATGGSAAEEEEGELGSDVVSARKARLGRRLRGMMEGRGASEGTSG